jgi:hypothetical protein
MKLANILLALFIGVLLASIISACSKSESPVEPVVNDADGVSQDVPVSFGAESGNRDVMAVYDAVIDPDNKTFTIEPANRTADYHYPLTQLCPDVLQITGYGWTPNFWADIKLVHPFPGSGIDAFDPRVIAILPANAGNEMFYPIFNVHANNAIILEPDGYTKMYDNLGGSIVGNANPFIAYFKEQAYRQWSSINPVEETKRWQMDINGFGGSFAFKLVVDVSTNYPQPSYPYIDNAPEPVQMQIEISDGLTNDGGSATVTATFLDWQGHSEIMCKVESPDLFDGSVQLLYTEPGPNPHEYVFTGSISNDLYAEPGDYDVLLAAWDINAGNHVFKEAVASVVVSTFHLIDVTPPWLNFYPGGICIDGNYLYIECLDSLRIYDISNPVIPAQVNIVYTHAIPRSSYVSNGYAYVTTDDSSLQIIDIDPPESAYLVNSVDIPERSSGVYVSDGYAYVADKDSGLQIIDIDPPESAYIMNSVDTEYAEDVYVSGGYAYLSCGWTGDVFQIVDIDPPESAYVVNTINTPGWVKDVYVSDGYAYVADAYSGLQIIDIDPPESAYIVNSVNSGTAYHVCVSNGYAYIGAQKDDYGAYGIYIFDIDPPESAHRVNIVETPSGINGVCINGNYAYVSDRFTGIQIIDISTPESANIVNFIPTPVWGSSVHVSDSCAYVTNCAGLQIIDIDPPQSAYIVNTVGVPSEARDVHVSNGYAYVADYAHGLQIIDIDPPESAYILNAVDTPRGTLSIYVSDGYAYVTDNSEFHIIDIEPPESAYIVNSIDIPHYGRDVYVSNGYAYVADQTPGLLIIDIDPVEAAYIVNTVDTPDGACQVDISSGYAYVADWYDGLQIIDIDPPESAHIVNSVDTPGTVWGVCVSDGYAYITDGDYGLQIIDIDPPELANIVDSFDPPSSAVDVYVSNGYAYMLTLSGGLRIIDLW